nr:probable serine/threonine-protein kinase DDB_G0278509 isoform X2 [Solanum lycopersicum]
MSPPLPLSYSAVMGGSGTGSDGSQSNRSRVLAERLRSLEASYVKLREQFNLLLEENSTSKDSDDDACDTGSYCGPGVFYSGYPYRNVLEDMGHALYVTKIGTGDIIYWNQAAEKLYGYKVHEVVGQRCTELLICEEYHELAMHSVKRLSCGQSWTDQFPFKKRSGEIFMAIVSKSLMYEDGELFGVVTVSSDAAFLNKINSEKSRTSQSSNGQAGRRGINFKSTRWHPQSQTASFVPNLVASKVFSFNRGEDAHRDREEVEGDTIGGQSQKPPRAPAARLSFSLLGRKSRTNAEISEMDESPFDIVQPSKLVAKVMSKLNITGFGNIGGEKCGNVQQNQHDETFANVNVVQPNLPPSSEGKYTHVLDAYHDPQNILKGSCFTRQRTITPENAQITSSDIIEGSIATCSRKFDNQINDNYRKTQIGNSKLPVIEDSSGQQLENQQSRKSGENTRSSQGSSSNKNENELSLVVHCEIRWEDISLSEDIGQGAFGVVYHGIWKGSDVAVKVFFGNQCGDTTLLDYKKEIDIMKRLRHPNVLLFMGAVSSQEKLAIITEYMPRGSLFKALHRNNPPLDLKRRLRMALDVARGMCYLHRRNPPIVHRDLKSSNLLVDKSWTVKVGDFGLSKLKHATFLTANSGRGTPQWMAPEVLRNEPSTEKSDVFSFGVILWELMTESVPWKDLNPLQVVGVVGFMDGRLDIPQKLDPRVSAIILDCWQSKPELRPSFEDISRRMTDIILSFGGLTSRKNSGGMVSNTD